MPDDPRVQQLIEEILDSGRSAEAVCRDTPQLLSQVREGWRRFRAIEARIDELFPEVGSVDNLDTPPSDGLPQVPGYDLIAVLGRGGVGVVYKAMHLSLNRTVALKMLLAGAFASRAERLRFSREAEVVAGLRHPNIVQVYDVGDLDGRPYLTMEFVEGGSLAEMIAGTPRPARQAAELLATLADAIEAAHRGGIVHRDLKPSNVLLTADGTPKISDFGLARHLEVGSSLTQTGVAVGTPSYMAPEQARGKSNETGPASDLYALGAVLYELLTGRPPFRAESAAETVHQVITRDPVPPSRLNAKVPRDLETICLKCLRKDPQLRYANASALAEDLRSFLRGETIAARPENGLQRLARRVRRRPVFSASITAGALITIALLIGGLWLITEQAATGRAADDDLREMVRRLEKSSWSEARAAMERAKGRLGEHGGSAELRRRLNRGIRELALVARLEAIRLDRAGSVGGKHPTERSFAEYLRALKEAELGEVGEASEIVAKRVRATSIKRALVAMLDESALLTRDPRLRAWLADVARLADDDPTGWRDQVRKSENGQAETAPADLVANAPVADDCVPLLIVLARRVDTDGGDPVPYLKRVQQAHPGDFWVNLELGETIRRRGNPGEAIRYFQAAMTIRPDAGVVYNSLGNALREASRYEEAADQFRQAIRIDPTAAQGYHNLANCLFSLGRHDEAIAQSRLAIRLKPDVAVIHQTLGVSLDAVGRQTESISEYRRAIALDPQAPGVRKILRDTLIRVGRTGEAQVAWAEAILADPTEHDVRKGYPEFCAFLGLEDEYRRACRVMLDHAESSTDPRDWEVAGRTCLLLPPGEPDLRRAKILIDRAMATQRVDEGFYGYFSAAKGLAEYRGGRHENAIAIMEKHAAGLLGPVPKLVVAMARSRLGQPTEARRSLALAVVAFDWSPRYADSADHWMYHVLRREAEALILPDLPGFLRGTYQPRDNDERLAMLGACQFMSRPASSARLYEEAFATDPRLASDLRAGHRYNAARAAALAGFGRETATATARLGELERRRWRGEARRWLRADLAAWSKVLDDPATDFALVRQTLTRWRADTDLNGLRELKDQDKLSADERNDCLSLWGEVGKVIERAGRAK